MLDGNSQELLNINEIDEGIRQLILTLNSYEGIETAGSCSGHFQDGKARGYIAFREITLEALNFFRIYGFMVKYDLDWWWVDIILEKSSGDITDKDIMDFWNCVGSEFKSCVKSN